LLTGVGPTGLHDVMISVTFTTELTEFRRDAV
jgi:hypothetical protein